MAVLSVGGYSEAYDAYETHDASAYFLSVESPVVECAPVAAAPTLEHLLLNQLIVTHLAPHLPVSSTLALATTSRTIRNALCHYPSAFRYLDLSTVKAVRHPRPSSVETPPRPTRSTTLDRSAAFSAALENREWLLSVSTLILDGTHRNGRRRPGHRVGRQVQRAHLVHPRGQADEHAQAEPGPAVRLSPDALPTGPRAFAASTSSGPRTPFRPRRKPLDGAPRPTATARRARPRPSAPSARSWARSGTASRRRRWPRSSTRTTTTSGTHSAGRLIGSTPDSGVGRRHCASARASSTSTLCSAEGRGTRRTFDRDAGSFTCRRRRQDDGAGAQGP